MLNTTCERRIIFWYQLQILMQLDLLSHLTNSSLCCALHVLRNMNKDSKIQLYRHLLNTYKRIYWVSYIGFLKSETLFPVKSWTIFQFSVETVMHFFLLSLYTSNLSLSLTPPMHIYTNIIWRSYFVHYINSIIIWNTPYLFSRYTTLVACQKVLPKN